MLDIEISVDDSAAVNLRFATALFPPPTGLAVVPVVGGGTFAAGNYFWQVTATSALGETTVSNEATTAIALNGSANLTWNAVNGAVTGYKIYRGTVTGAENILVTTVGAGVTAFTDTNVGGAGAPPGTNTAEQSDYLLITGKCWYEGFSIAETSGTTAAFIEILDNGGTVEEIRLASGASQARGPVTKNVPIDGFIKVHVVSGAARGVVYARIPPVC